MKINYIILIILLAISALIGYAFNVLSQNENSLIISMGSFVFSALTLVIGFAVKFSTSNSNLNVRAVSILFWCIAMLVNGVFVMFDFGRPAYIIISGISVLVFTLIVYAINNAKV